MQRTHITIRMSIKWINDLQYDFNKNFFITAVQISKNFLKYKNSNEVTRVQKSIYTTLKL